MSCLVSQSLRNSAHQSFRHCTIRSFSTQPSTPAYYQSITRASNLPYRKPAQGRRSPYVYRHLKEGPLAAPLLEEPTLPEHRINIQSDDLKAQYVDGQWRRPKVSAMTLARERKVALIRGEQFPFQRQEPARKSKPVTMKGHKHERTAASRKSRVELAMKEMPARIEEYYKQLHSRRKEDSQALRLLGAAALNNLTGKGKQSKKAKKKQQAEQ